MNKRNIFGLILLGAFLIFAFSVGFGIIDIKTPNIKDYQGWLPAVVFVSAIIDSINPCAFSILFLSIAFLFSLKKTRKNILIAGSFYVFGIFLVYTLIGLGILQTLDFFNTPHFVSKLGATLLIVVGLISLLGEIFPKFPIKLKIPDIAKGKIAKYISQATFFTAFILGLIVGINEFPCTGGPYLFILGLLHDEANFWSGFGYLLFYNLVFVLPLILILALSSDVKTLETVESFRKKETKKVRIWLALILVILGALIIMI
jgi:cytochrome c biogenesis protein CcdA